MNKILTGHILKKSFLIATLMASSFAYATEFSSPNNKIVVTPANPDFTITLKSNPTTGYSWKVTKIDSNLFKNTGHKYVAPNTKLIGASGYDVWTFKAIYPTAYHFRVNQVGHIVMEYNRPWEKRQKTALEQHFTIVLQKK